MPDQTPPPQPPLTLVLMVRDILRCKTANVALTLTRSCYDRAQRLQRAADTAAADWYAMALIAASKAGQLISDQLIALVPHAPPFVVSGSLLERLQNAIRE